ncbi:MAG: FkbM family methyltransferase [Bacteroidales bacterium]|nr:FkbM family methyltransferase [Bacteroidales bacterium]
MNKIITFSRYLKDFLKNRQFIFVLSAIKYEILGRTTSKHRMYKSDLGLFFSRKGTLDFQFANIAYEWNVKQYMLKNYHNNTTFLDLGANIGTYSILLGQKGLKCFAVEAVESNFRAMNINILLNQLESQIKTYNVCLGETVGEASFIFDPINTGASHIAGNGEKGILTKVNMKPLDALIHEFGLDPKENILIKMDVEGMETAVINGGAKFLSTYPNIHLIMESDHTGTEQIKKTLNKYAKFKYYEIDNLNIAAVKINE